MSTKLSPPPNIRPSRNNFSIYINEEDRDLFGTLKIFCGEEIQLPLSQVILRAVRFWIAHFPNHQKERWRRAAQKHFDRRKHRVRNLTKIMMANSQKSTPLT